MDENERSIMANLRVHSVFDWSVMNIIRAYVYYSAETNELYVVHFKADRIFWREDFLYQKKIETWAEFVGVL